MTSLHNFVLFKGATSCLAAFDASGRLISTKSSAHDTTRGSAAALAVTTSKTVTWDAIGITRQFSFTLEPNDGPHSRC